MTRSARLRSTILLAIGDVASPLVRLVVVLSFACSLIVAEQIVLTFVTSTLHHFVRVVV